MDILWIIIHLITLQVTRGTTTPRKSTRPTVRIKLPIIKVNMMRLIPGRFNSHRRAYLESSITKKKYETELKIICQEVAITFNEPWERSETLSKEGGTRTEKAFRSTTPA